MTIPELTKQAATLRSLADRAREACEKLKRTKADADAELTRLLKGDLRHFPANHQQQVRKTIEADLVKQRTPAAGLSLFELEQAGAALLPEIQHVREQHRQAPSAEAAHLKRSRQAGLGESAGFQLRILDRLERAELRATMGSATPLQWSARYQAALLDPLEQANAAFIRYCEELHTDAWAGPALTDEKDVTAAHALRKLIHATRDARVPAELADVEAARAEAGKVAQKARDVYAVIPFNPENDPRAAELAAAE